MSRCAVSFRENQRSVFGHSSFPTPQEQLSRSVYVIDDVGRIGTLHVKVDLLIRQQSGKLRRRRSYYDPTLDGRRRGEFFCHITDKIAKMLLDLLLMNLRNDSQSKRLRFYPAGRLPQSRQAKNDSNEEGCNRIRDFKLAHLYSHQHKGSPSKELLWRRYYTNGEIFARKKRTPARRHRISPRLFRQNHADLFIEISNHGPVN